MVLLFFAYSIDEQILKKRKQLNDECNFLRQQNTEITHLLQQCAKDDLLKYTNN